MLISKIKNIVLNLDKNTKDIVLKSSKTMFVKVLGMVSGLVVSVFLGRTLGAEGLGIINLSNRVVSILLIFSVFGFGSVIIKNVAIGFGKKDYNLIGNTVKTSLLFNSLLAIIIMLIFIPFIPFICTNFFREPLLEVPLMIAVLLLLPQTLSRIYSGALNGLGKIWQSNLVNQTLSIIIVGLGLLILFLFSYEITLLRVVLLYALGRVIVTASVYFYWNKVFNKETTNELLFKPMLKMATPLLLVSATAVIASNADVMMIGWLSNTKEVGLYSVAARLALLVSFFLQVSNSVIAPKLAIMYEKKHIDEMQFLVKKVTKGLFLIAILSLVFFVFFGEFMLSIWGIEFVAAHSILVVLAVGQFFNISTGCAGVLLVMSGFEKIHGYISFFSLLLNLLLNFLLITHYGAIGAAVATAIIIILENITKLIVVKNKVGILTIPF